MPVYQGERWLRETLTAVRAQAYPMPVEIVAVDSESTDRTREILAEFGATVIVIPQARFSHGYARNLGVARAQNPIIVFMSQDALPVGENWLAGLVDSLAAPAVGAVYARQVARPDATPLEIFFHESLYPPTSARYKLQPGESVSLARIFFSNVCSAARREVCLAHPFDENLIMSEDQAFAKALLVAGFQTVYNADVQVLHSHHYNLPTLFRRNFDSAWSLRGVSEDTGLSTARQGIDYVGAEIGYVVRARRWRWLAAIPAYEMTRIAGRLLGGSADRLPRRWRIAFSLHRGYWTREPAVAESGS